jgi:NADH dehydrogenase
MTFILIGAGPTGVEMAGAIADLAHFALKKEFRNIDPTQARILLLEAGPRILTAFSERLSQRAQRDLKKMGVEVKTGCRVKNIDSEGVHLTDQVIPCENMIWTAGVSASPAGQWLNAEVDRAGRVIVQSDQSIPDNPNIFVIGDTASARDENGKPYPGLAPVAMQQGTYVASLIRNRIEQLKQGRSFSTPSRRFHYRDKGNLATIGRTSAIADIKGLQIQGFVGWVIWASVHILYLITFRNRILVMLQWAFLYLTYQRGGRLIVTTESTGRKKHELKSKAA